MKTDFERVVQHHTGDEKSVAELRIGELVRFLRLVNTSSESQVPSKWVDEAWHALLADKIVYQEFLASKGLKFVSHVPGTSSLSAYLETRDLILQDPKALFSAWPFEDFAGCEGCSGDTGGENT